MVRSLGVPADPSSPPPQAGDRQDDRAAPLGGGNRGRALQYPELKR
ncbi:MAG TPA: hypothetical protein PLW67_08755 [Prolixibacteraceae bacterium]|nr:hypothetical protein [Prolixibacteraceae bacterium]